MKEKIFKVVLLGLMGFFFGCSKVDRYNQIEPDYIMDISQNKNTLSKVTSISFSEKGKYLYLTDDNITK